MSPLFRYRGMVLSFVLLWTLAVSNAALAQENRRFNGTRIENRTGQTIDVMILGRRKGVLDRNYRVAPGGPRPTSEGYLFGGWRAVCWCDSETGDFLGSKMVKIDRHNQVIPIELDPKIYLLPSYSCTGDDPDKPETIQARQNSASMIAMAFRAHVPDGNLVVYGEDPWRDATNVLQSRLGYNRDDVRRAIETCPAGTNDTLIFHWDGHGGGPEHYFAMVGGGSLKRRTAAEWLERKGTRLSILLTDTCAESVPARAIAEPAAPMGPAVISPLFYDLFIKPRGFANINSASPRQYAFRSDPLGSFFTLVLANRGVGPNQGYLWASAGARKSWVTALDEVQVGLTARFRKFLPNGYPTSDGTIQRDQTIWRKGLPETRPLPSPRCSNCKIKNNTGFPLDVMIVGRRDGVLDRNYSVGPGETKRTAEGYLYGGSRAVAWWRNDDPGKTGIGTTEVVVREDGQVIEIR